VRRRNSARDLEYLAAPFSNQLRHRGEYSERSGRPARGLLGPGQVISRWFCGRAGRFTADLAKTVIEANILASLPVLASAKRRLVLADSVGEFQEAPLREPALDHRITSSGRMQVDVSKFVGDRAP
jgi:hypothetical protein